MERSRKLSMAEQTSPNPSLGQESPTTATYRRESNASSAPPRIRRRNRLITSCLECRRRKLKCDKKHPCTNCTRFTRDCVFLAPALDPAAQMKLAEIKEKMGSLERTLEQDIARGPIIAHHEDRKPSFNELSRNDDSSDDDSDASREEKDLEPTNLALLDATYFEDADDDLMDLGVQVGKMRVTERMGGFVRPKLANELAWVLRERMACPVDSDEILAASSEANAASLTSGGVVQPGADYIAPAASFFFAPEPSAKSSFWQYMPSKLVADRLLEQYWTAVHFMCKCVHRPSFERQYALFWNIISSGNEPPASLQAVVLAAMLSATISMSEERILVEFGVDKAQFHQSFQKGTEAALYHANFLRSTKLQTLQAFIMYLIPLCRGQVSRAHSALTGTAIRLAECMGLHRDASHYIKSPVEIHVRRLLWHQLCFLDLRTCESTGPRLQIHREDYDTEMPLNANDEDLERGVMPIQERNGWTDSTFTIIRFLGNEMHRSIWFERSKLEKKKVTLTAVLARVQGWINSIEQKYIPWMSRDNPNHMMAFMTYKITAYRLYVAVLHRLCSNHLRLMPTRIRRLLLSSATSQVECAIIMDTNPSLSPWAWYTGALHQYYTTLLLLTELYATPDHCFEDRIWKCLDYVFNLEDGQDRQQKAKFILTDVMQKTFAYHALRKLRAPKTVEDEIEAEEDKYAASVASGTTPTNLPLLSPTTSAATTVRPEKTSPIPLYPPAPTAHHMQSTTSPVQSNNEYHGYIPQQQQQQPQQQQQLQDTYYAFPNYGSNSPYNADQQPQSMMGTENSQFQLGHSPMDTMQDLDWNELDKLFPPEGNFAIGHVPDFTFQEGTTFYAPSVYAGMPKMQQG